MGQEEKRPEKHTIKVFAKDKTFSVSKDRYKVGKNEFLRWECDDAKIRFRIVFASGSPFHDDSAEDPVVCAHDVATGYRRVRIVDTETSFKYSVEADGHTTLDPVIIIDPDPSPGGGGHIQPG